MSQSQDLRDFGSCGVMASASRGLAAGQQHSVGAWCADDWCHAIVLWVMTIDITAWSGRLV